MSDKLNNGFRHVVQQGTQRLVVEGIDYGRHKAVASVQLDELRFSYTSHSATATLEFVLTQVPDQSTADAWNRLFAGFVAGMDPKFREVVAGAISKSHLLVGPKRSNAASQLATLFGPEAELRVSSTAACAFFWALSLGTADPDGWVGSLCR
ncbi:hypothetical protein [Paludisphaera mucosa]|uniref:Uncharacterized protein n=1 Tax=Paludisphaera mucosa TaxID=3030827 RepID=A0ABT6FE86_9BACT|nr:hypothetical protein [Paludisphaera mucosa]MDG3005889.1 hypothetical protein [Paludisphaera mucosa]